jgi:hypothetical protein
MKLGKFGRQGLLFSQALKQRAGQCVVLKKQAIGMMIAHPTTNIIRHNPTRCKPLEA